MVFRWTMLLLSSSPGRIPPSTRLLTRVLHFLLRMGPARTSRTSGAGTCTLRQADLACSDGHAYLGTGFLRGDAARNPGSGRCYLGGAEDCGFGGQGGRDSDAIGCFSSEFGA